MGLKGPLVAVVVAFVIAYTFVFENPLFEVDTGSIFSQGSPQLQVTPFLPAAPSSRWTSTVLSYACGGSGPGFLQVTNGRKGAVNVVSVSLTYGGLAYQASGPLCPAAPGTTLISITALGGLAGAQGSTYTGYVAASDGTRTTFSGTWQ